MSRILRVLTDRSVLFWTLSSGLSVLVLGVIDFLTGYEISFSLFYLAPVSAASWFAGPKAGILIASLSAITWLMAELASGHTFLSPFINAWNTLIRFGFFLIVTMLLHKLRESYRREQELARTDLLTGVPNSRHFYEVAQTELARARRYGHPFALAFFDLDNFKKVNDRYGHAQGDEVLRVVGGVAQRHLRATDCLARLGGDEFVLLLPDTDQAGAQTAVSKLHAEMLSQMQVHRWPVTFSIGVIIFVEPPESVDAMMQLADQTMYAVKNDSKDGVRFDCYGD